MPLIANGSAQVDKEYLGALDNLIREYGAREICAEAYICKADLLRNMGASYMDEALQTCDEAREALFRL